MKHTRVKKKRKCKGIFKYALHNYMLNFVTTLGNSLEFQSLTEDICWVIS